jgi:hypothetical protein
MTGQLNFDFRSHTGTPTGDRRDKGTALVVKDRPAKVRAKVRRHPRSAPTQDEWFVRELISAIHRMWQQDKHLIYAIHGLPPWPPE